MNADEAPSLVDFLDGIGVVDAHHHFWELGRFPYDWLAPDSPPGRFGEKTTLRRDFLVPQYLGSFADIPLVASVHVQANCGASDPVEETRWLQAIKEETGWPNAIIAELDPLSPQAARQIDRHLDFPIFRGVRVPVGWDSAGRWRIARQPHVMKDPAFRQILPSLEARDLCLELVIVPEQFGELVDLARSHPELKIVINHCATLEVDRADNVRDWMVGVEALEELSNVYVKLSGLWTAHRAWSAAVLAPFLDHLLAAVGAGRTMYGSNMPIEAVNCPVQKQFEELKKMLAGARREEVEKIFAGTARGVYNLTSL